MSDSSHTSGGTNLFRPVQTKRASEAIYDQIRELIMQGKLRPGDRLPSERGMIEMFQRSRPTIREALRMLEREGYIRIMAGSTGAVILSPDHEHLENSLIDALNFSQITSGELAEYRLASEVSTAVWAAQRRTDEDINAMESLLAEMADYVSDLDHFSKMDSVFHGLVAQAAKNTLSVIFNRTFSRLNRSFLLNKRAAMPKAERDKICLTIQRQHIAIFEAIRNGDADQAGMATQEHLIAFRDELLEDTV